jgi:hypothetical protein
MYICVLRVINFAPFLRFLPESILKLFWCCGIISWHICFHHLSWTWNLPCYKKKNLYAPTNTYRCVEEQLFCIFIAVIKLDIDTFVGIISWHICFHHLSWTWNLPCYKKKNSWYEYNVFFSACCMMFLAMICSRILQQIKVITKLPNSEQSYKGKVQTHNYINRLKIKN